MSVPTYDMSIHQSTDAAVWAKEFCRIANRIGYIKADGTGGGHVEHIDEGWMIGWFANAIETAKDIATKAERERAANTCERMVIGGRAWNHEQQVSAEALMAAAEAIRLAV